MMIKKSDRPRIVIFSILQVLEIRAFSGHYRPKRENLLAFLQMLCDQGVDTKQVRFKQFKNK